MCLYGLCVYMCVYVTMWLCGYVSIRVAMCLCVYMSTCLYGYVSICVSIWLCIYIYFMNVAVRLYVYVAIWLCV